MDNKAMIQRVGELIRLQRVYQWNGDAASSLEAELEIARFKKELWTIYWSMTETEHAYLDEAYWA